MKKIHGKKLKLNTERIKTLVDEQLGQAVGGYLTMLTCTQTAVNCPPNTAACPTYTCYTVNIGCTIGC